MNNCNSLLQDRLVVLPGVQHPSRRDGMSESLAPPEDLYNKTSFITSATSQNTESLVREKFDEFGELSVICQTKPSKFILIITIYG